MGGRWTNELDGKSDNEALHGFLLWLAKEPYGKFCDMNIYTSWQRYMLRIAVEKLEADGPGA